MKKITLLMLFVFLGGMLHAQTTDTIPKLKRGYVQLSLFHPIGTAWKSAKKKRYNFSLNLIHGNVGAVEGVEIGLISNVVQGHMYGFQFGTSNVVKRRVAGFQAGLLTNVNMGDADGFQLSGLWTHNQGTFRGFQFSWIGNTNFGNTYGLQLSHILNYTHRNFNGIAFALGPNISMGNGLGIQMTASVNVVKHYHNGLQFAFLGNYAEVSDGIQLGAVNVTRKSGWLQIGLVNYSGDSSVATIGLINIVKGGYNKLELWGGELQTFNLALKTGGRSIYSVINVGANPFNQNKFWTIGWGFGTHIRLGKRFYADIDQITSLVNINEPISLAAGRTTVLNQMRFTAGIEVSKRIAFFIGPVWNILLSNNNTLYDARTGTHSLNGTDLAPTFRTFRGEIGDYRFAMWPGIGGGIRFF